MAPPDFSNDNSVNSGTLQPHNNIRENLLENNHEKIHNISTQANLAVEVGLIVLDSLGLFSFHFKVIRQSYLGKIYFEKTFCKLFNSES